MALHNTDFDCGFLDHAVQRNATEDAIRLYTTLLAHGQLLRSCGFVLNDVKPAPLFLK